MKKKSKPGFSLRLNCINLFFSAGVTIPTLETHQMLVDGVPYNQIPILHIKSTLNNTLMVVTDSSGRQSLGLLDQYSVTRDYYCPSDNLNMSWIS